MGGGGGGSKQSDVTKVREETTTRLGDIGLTGENFVQVAEAAFEENRDAASEVNESFQIGAKNLSGALATGFKALSDTSESVEDVNVARATGRSPDDDDAADGTNFGGFDVTTTALILGAVASAVTIMRTMK